MNTQQDNIATMCRNSSSELEKMAATTVCPALVTTLAALKTKLGEINTHAAIQALPITGRTMDRETVFVRLWSTAFVVAGLVHAYATKNQLHDLAAKVRLTRSQLQRGRIRRRIELTQQIHDAAVGVLLPLAAYNITAATLEDLQEKIDAADAMFTAVRAAIAQRKHATAELGKALRHAHALLEQEIDPIVESQREINPEGYALYRTARMIIHRPARLGKSAPGDGSTPTQETVPLPAAA